MAITQRQFNHLNEMGIKVWQQRDTETSSEVNEPQSTQHSQTNSSIVNKQQLSPIAIDANSLTQQVLFADILQSIDVSIGEITFENEVINLGLFNWQFIETDKISFANSTLTTPTLNNLENSTTLKRALWKTLQQEVLV